nr:retrovirus-related Pol polyprotein from transposon TNT 1-94 [Tanacetum cinerariifolium]
MFRIIPFKLSREEKHVPNKVSASVRTNLITVSQPPVITKKVVNSDSNGLSSTVVDITAKTKRPQPRSNTKNDREIAQQTFTPSTSMKWPLHPQFASWLVLLPPSHGYGINVYPNFDTINDLAKNNLVTGLPKFKYHKGHLCPSCEQGKSKRASHPPKPVTNSRQRLHLLHMDLCCPMRIASINGKRSKDEAPEVIKTFLKRISILLQSPVIIIKTDNGTEFKNQVLKEYFDSVGISHQVSSVRTPQQNGVVEQRNRTLVEAATTMLIFSHAPLFLCVEAIATTCFTKNRSIIHRRFNKTPYELINSRKPDISFLHVFRALCYPKNNREDIGKLGAKGDIGFL